MTIDPSLLFHVKLTNSKGNQLKCVVNHQWYKADYLGYEGASEYLCSYILQQSNIQNYVTYNLSSMTIAKSNTHLKGCVSDNFLQKDDTIVTAHQLLQQCKYPNFPLQYKKQSLKQRIQSFVEDIEELTGIKEYGKILTQMLEFDQFVLNDDRHFNNIAFIRHSDGSYDPAPLFDNGGAFLSDTKMDYPLGHHPTGMIPNVGAKPFCEDFDKQVEICQQLYGTQLKLSKTLEIGELIKQNIIKNYGQQIFDRMDQLFQHQCYMYDEYLLLDNEFTQMHDDSVVYLDMDIV